MIKNPVIGLKFANLIRNGAASYENNDDYLMGWIDNLSINTIVEAGYFTQKSGRLINALTKEQLKRVPVSKFTLLDTFDPGGIFPKVYTLSCNFNVIHDRPKGFDMQNNKNYDHIAY
jgi:hypothetical protein